jgi:hypothetical protein
VRNQKQPVTGPQSVQGKGQSQMDEAGDCVVLLSATIVAAPGVSNARIDRYGC